MTPDQITILCDSLATGSGRYQAAAAAGITAAELAESLATDTPLRQRVALIEGSLKDQVRQVLYTKATAEASLPAARAYLASLDAERMGRLDYRLKRREVAAIEKHVDNQMTPSVQPNFACLSNDEFRRYKELYISLRVRDHTPAESVEYSAFARRLAMPPEAVATAKAPRFFAPAKYAGNHPPVVPYTPIGHTNGHGGNGTNGHGYGGPGDAPAAPPALGGEGPEDE
jgi:hypothetical protein